MFSSQFSRIIRSSCLSRSFTFYAANPCIVSTEWVYNRLGSVKIIDTTRHITPKKDGKEEFMQRRIPGAQYFNLEEICQKEGSLIKKLPTSDQFKKAIESLGISTNDEIVLYDSQGVYSAARVWYMFHVFNKNAKVHVMNGGMIRWETEKYPIDEKPYKAPTAQGSFEVNPDFSLVCTLDEMKQRVKDYKDGLTKRTVIDCRRVCCFTGTCKVPIANVPLGHIPGSVNIPFHYMTDPYNNYMMRKPDELKQIFEKHGVMVHEPEKMIFSCDYGISSCVNLFAMHLLGRPLENCAIYDGSWIEYSLQKDTEKDLC